MLNEALKLARLGLQVFPLQPNSKIPFKNPPGTPEGEGGCKLASSDPAVLQRWWRWLVESGHKPPFNIGILLGSRSKVVAMDIDYNHGADPEFVKSLPTTVLVRSANGHHAYFKHQEGMTSGIIIPGPNKGEDAVYLRCDGYYVVAPPSIHPDGAEYRFEDHAGYPDGGLSFFNLKPAELPDQYWHKPKSQAATSRADKKYGENSRHDMFLRTATALRAEGKDFDQIYQELHRRNQQDCNPPKEGKEADDEFRKIAQWAIGKVQIKEKHEAHGKEARSKKPCPYDIAVDMAQELQYACADAVALRHYRQDFYRHSNGIYKPVDKDSLKAEVNSWLVKTGLQHLIGTKVVSSIIDCLKMAPIHVPSDVTLPCLIDGLEVKRGEHLLPLRNGLLDVEDYIRNGNTKLLPNDANFFSTYQLPYDFDPEAACPTYDAIALNTFESQQKKELWEEIMGIHLFSPFILEHFFVLQGQGSNGKSVLINILTNLLGQENISSVPLECFKPDNFTFSTTYGKLANIISDQDDVENFNEGLVKQFVTREPMTFNRKNKDAFTARPTAYLTILCNSLPRFNDKTDGIWRRLVLFQLKKQVEESKRDPRYVNPNFWKESGELAGILNRAIAGIARVMKNGRLSNNLELVAEMKTYREELDNVTQFARKALTFDAGSRNMAMPVYRAYSNMTRANGEKPVAAKTFKRRMLEFATREKLAVQYRDQVRFENNKNTSGWYGFTVNRDCEFAIDPSFLDIER